MVRELLILLALQALLLTACGKSGAPESLAEMPTPAAAGSLAPRLAATPDGDVLLSWLEPRGEDAHALNFAMLSGGQWSAPRTVAAASDWFVNSSDVPSVIPITADTWVSHWLVKKPGGTYAYDIAMSVSGNAGTTWGASMTPHLDDTPTEHGFVSIFPWRDGFGAVWLDGRNMQPDPGADSAGHDAATDGSMSLRFGRFDMSGALVDKGEIDGRVCECCQTDVTNTPGGPVVAYRGRTEEEIRDILVTRYTDGQWQKPLTISDDRWMIRGCPVNGPAIDADGERVVVAWYAAPERKTRVKVAWSQDGGSSFGPPILIDDAGVRGRVDIELLDDGSAIVSWVGKTEQDDGLLLSRRVTETGELGDISSIETGEYSRSSGIPRLMRSGEQLVFAWPQAGEQKTIRTAVRPIGQ